ncbi:nuclear transport factor 2 family protein [Streptomyces sp. SID13031]|uniref:nuclear transport factor 2 family protein n=1 Tax=Streptomyces sp. SID13031 TaxID=2706046 RepID=UPI0013CA3B40|nr:nuclear transport factor 2 family protein [Streptomyces sp. SID13031]NEA34081.1 ketosteroid isomerase [Streptomyces sp. SID13031]
MTPEEVFLRLVHGVADHELDALPALYAEQTDVRHPMSPYGGRPLLSRDALREHFGGTGPQVAEVVRFQPDAIRVHQTQDPEVIVAEFDYAGTVIATGESFRVPCVFVLRVRDGEIVESRDYIDHVAMARARGRLGELIAVLREPAAARGAS